MKQDLCGRQSTEYKQEQYLEEKTEQKNNADSRIAPYDLNLSLDEKCIVDCEAL